MSSASKRGGAADDEEAKLERVVTQVRRRREFWERSGELPLGRALAMMGRFGWTIAGPPLLGAIAGRWLDRMFQSGVFWSATLIFFGVGVGFYMAWRGMRIES
jgi:ATP synthase protein I